MKMLLIRNPRKRSVNFKLFLFFNVIRTNLSISIMDRYVKCVCSFKRRYMAAGTKTHNTLKITYSILL